MFQQCSLAFKAMNIFVKNMETKGVFSKASWLALSASFE